MDRFIMLVPGAGFSSRINPNWSLFGDMSPIEWLFRAMLMGISNFFEDIGEMLTGLFSSGGI